MKPSKFQNLPAELRALPQWVGWKLTDRGGKPTKIPTDPKTGRPASTTDPETWGTFEDAVSAVDRLGLSGIGFVFTESDPYTGIDLDKCRDPETGRAESWAREIVGRFNSYAELSVSGTGAHILIRGKVPGTRRRKGKIEVYDTGRFFCMTGDRITECRTVEDRQEELKKFCEEIFRESEYTAPAPSEDRKPAPLDLSDVELIEKAKAAANGDTFTRLWEGDWQGAGFTSQSEADAALLSRLRFWTGGDKGRAFALFSASGLARKKWEREDYREKTWAAIAGGKVYEPPPPGPRLGGKQVQAAPPPVEALEEMLHDEEGADRFKPFPADVLPEPHRSLVIKGARSIGCDPSLVALPLLASTAAAIGNARRVEIKKGWTEPAVLWCVPVALSGDGKSPAFDAGTDGLNHIEDREHAEYLSAVEEHKREVQAWKDAGSEGPKPEAPKAIRHVVRDTTVEGLALLLADSPRGLLLARDELAAWVGGFDRYQGGRGEESAHWLEFYRAGRVSVDRKSGEPRHIHIRRAAVSITGTIQPATLERLLEQKHFETGLAARLLLAHPPRSPRRWNEGELSSALLERVRAVFERLTALPMGTDEHGQPAPVDLPFTEAAKVRWIRFFNEHAEEAEGLEDDRLLSAWSKLEGTAARFALILQLIEDPESAAVDLPALERGLVLLDWFKHETRRIYGQLAESVEFRDCKAVLDAIRKREGVAKARDLYRSGILNSDKERVERTLDLLAGRGLGKWVEIPTGTGGGRPTREFHLSEPYTQCETRKTAKPPPNPPKSEPDETAKLTKPTKPGENKGSVSCAGFAEGGENNNPDLTPEEGTL